MVLPLLGRLKCDFVNFEMKISIYSIRSVTKYSQDVYFDGAPAVGQL